MDLQDNEKLPAALPMHVHYGYPGDRFASKGEGWSENIHFRSRAVLKQYCTEIVVMRNTKLRTRNC